MELNKNLKQHLNDVEKKDEGILYLLSAFHALEVDCIPQSTIRQVNATGIVERDLDNGVLQWNVPLYESQNIDNVWSWVDEFRDKFKRVNPERSGTKQTCIQRMKKWFSENPQYRKEDVLEATDMYLRVTDSRYIMKAHKFIYDGIGVMKNSTLSEWVEKYIERKDRNKNDNNIKMM